MKNLILSAFVFVLKLFCLNDAHSYLITFNFAGTIDTDSYPLIGNLDVGDTYTGSFTVDTDAIPTYPNALSSIYILFVTGIEVYSDYVYVFVTNSEPGMGSDIFSLTYQGMNYNNVECNPIPDPCGSFCHCDLLYLYLSFYDDDGTFFETDYFTENPSIELIDQGSLLVSSDLDPQWFGSSDVRITSVPDCGIMLLLGPSLIVLVGFGRRFKALNNHK